MKSIKILFKSIVLNDEEKEYINNFFKEYGNSNYSYFPIYDEKEYKNAIHFNLVVWISNEELEEDFSHYILKYENFIQLKHDLADLVINIDEIYLKYHNYEKTPQNRRSLVNKEEKEELNEDDFKKSSFSSILLGGDGELDVSKDMASVGKDIQQQKKDVKSSNPLTSIDPFSKTFK